jgi:hypothetical protein
MLTIALEKLLLKTRSNGRLVCFRMRMVNGFPFLSVYNGVQVLGDLRVPRL